MKPQQAIRELTKNIQTGRNLSSKWKIFEICLLRYVEGRSPPRIEKYVHLFVDVLANGMLIETDVRFLIRTLNDFFIFSSLWEEELQEALAFRRGMNFLDVGAHIGKYALRAALKVGKQGRVIAVEPDRDNFNLLLKNMEINGLTNCIPLNLAAYYTDTKINLYRGVTPAQHSVKENFGRGSQMVQARALDNVLKEKGIEKLDLVKVDVEGAEYEVLKGLEKTLINKNPVLVIEIMKRDERKIIEYLEKLGYRRRLLHVFVPFRGGLMFYQFEKAN